MSDQTLPDLFHSTLAGVDLSARARNKFDRLVEALADRWGLTSGAIAVKALGAPKNFGNRISEATRLDIERLVLLADGELDVEALVRNYEARAVRVVPTLIAKRRPEGWVVVATVGASGAGDPFGTTAPMFEMPPRTVEAMDTAERDRLIARLRGLDGLAYSDVRRQVELASQGGYVVAKQVFDRKNLGNRIAEAVGQRPPFVLVETTLGLARAAANEIERTVPSGVVVFVLWDEGDVAQVEEFRSNPTGEAAAAQPAVADAPEPDHSEEATEQPVRRPEYRRLERVRQLLAHLPFDAGADRLYEEHQKSSDQLSYETQTLGYLRGLLEKGQRQVIVLTGNAGHGKTHMCRRLLESGGANPDAMAQLSTDLVGGVDWDVVGAGLPVRVVKDLSELDLTVAAQRLEALLMQQGSHAIVCANEGRLRAVVAENPAHLDPLLGALESGLASGATCPADRDDVHVVNLNFQAATADTGGFLSHVLDQFLNYESAWKVCDSCLAREECPIRWNRDALAMSPARVDENRRHREVLVEMVRIAEEGGYVLTFRETLVFVAFLVTGGLSCDSVETAHRRRGAAERLAKYRVLRLLFEHELQPDELEILRVLDKLRRLDPGLIALRPVDERMHELLEHGGGLGDDVFGDGARQLHKRADLKREQEGHRWAVRNARRVAWFDAPEIDDDGVHRTERLGLRHHREFRMLQGNAEFSEVIPVLRRLVRGLHTIQGAVGVGTSTSLHLVDPAFGRSGSHSAIIARSIRIKDLDLWSESRWWEHVRGAPPPMLGALEWIDRRVVLSFRPETRLILSLDLHAFEFVMNAADGVVMREFHSAERRRILRTIARHAEERDGADDEIRVLLERGEGTLTLERDDTILLESTS